MNAKPYNFFLIIVLTHFFVFSSLKSNDASSKDLAIHHFMQGEFLLNQGNYALAVLEFQDAISIDPNASTIHVSIADAYRSMYAKVNEDVLNEELIDSLIEDVREEETNEWLDYLEETKTVFSVPKKNQKKVHNHIGTVHAIAMCNAAELAGGMATDVSIPSGARWIPQGMTVEYLAKAKTDLRVVCDVEEVDFSQPGKIIVSVAAFDKTPA